MVTKVDHDNHHSMVTIVVTIVVTMMVTIRDKAHLTVIFWIAPTPVKNQPISGWWAEVSWLQHFGSKLVLPFYWINLKIDMKIGFFDLIYPYFDTKHIQFGWCCSQLVHEGYLLWGRNRLESHEDAYWSHSWEARFSARAEHELSFPLLLRLFLFVCDRRAFWDWPTDHDCYYDGYHDQPWLPL